MDAFQPNPWLVNFILLKEFFYLPVVAILALLRSGVAQGPSRQAGMLALVLAVLGSAAQLGPAVFGFGGGAVMQAGIRAGDLANGMALPLAASLPLALSAVLRGVRWRWIDLVHLTLLAALLGLWTLTW